MLKQETGSIFPPTWHSTTHRSCPFFPPVSQGRGENLYIVVSRVSHFSISSKIPWMQRVVKSILYLVKLKSGTNQYSSSALKTDIYSNASHTIDCEVASCTARWNPLIFHCCCWLLRNASIHTPFSLSCSTTKHNDSAFQEVTLEAEVRTGYTKEKVG